jgi:hypothetical protein
MDRQSYKQVAMNEADMASMRFGVGVLVALALAGCTSAQNAQPQSNAKMFGLISGDLPPAKPFVVESRSQGGANYPAVGITPPPRTEKVLTRAEQVALEADLKAAAGRGGAAPRPRRPLPEE